MNNKILKCDKELGPVIKNIALMLEQNADRFAERTAFQQKAGVHYLGIKWKELYNSVLNIAFNLKEAGFSKGDKMVLFSPNRLEMLQTELAVMASGGIAVPIFAHFKKETAELLIRHSDAAWLAVAGQEQLDNLGDCHALQGIYVFDELDLEELSNLRPFSNLTELRSEPGFHLFTEADPDDLCLYMYTSGTMGIPKCVQLSHGNILSQQAALDIIWDIDENDRFLSYLPWHHSFGGIFELFTALYNGAAISVESGYGKDPLLIMENWALVQPTVFFSVPKVYQALVELSKQNPGAEARFFGSGLKFVFTAAAPLPDQLTKEFEDRGIPVIEGWGLTETAPCCTLTDPMLKRELGVVGQPIPGVQIRIAADSEIELKGPNIMKGYYKNKEANKDIFTKDGWYRTGDIGELTDAGLKLITRKDRIFKLSNGEKVVPTDLEQLIEKRCHYISFALVSGGGEDYPVALLFPNKKLLEEPDYQLSPMEGCFCPRDLNDLGNCLSGCLHDANCGIGQKFAKIKAAMLINDELSIDNDTLTPSMKLIPKNVMQNYKSHLAKLYGKDVPLDEEVYVIKLDTTTPKSQA